MPVPPARSLRQTNLAANVATPDDPFVAQMRERPCQLWEKSLVQNCLAQGYAPKSYGLADFTIIRAGGFFHLFHIPRVPGGDPVGPGHEHWLAHAVSEDLDTWRMLDPALCVEPHRDFEAAHLWAPFVFFAHGRHHLFYTGLSRETEQVLCLATSEDPELCVWQRHPGNPLHPREGFDWQWRTARGLVKNARDPHVVPIEDGYLLAYTGMHCDGCSVVGGMISRDLVAWEDIGPLLYRPMVAIGKNRAYPWPPESVNIQPLPDGRWALIPSQSPGLEYYLSETPFSWHGCAPQHIAYAGGPPAGLEVIHRDETRRRWLVAWFEDERLWIGILKLDSDPWTLERCSERSSLTPFLGSFRGSKGERLDVNG